MHNSKQYYLDECIEMITVSSKYEHNILLIKHGNTLNISSENIVGNGLFHTYRNSEVLRPYEPFMDFIKDYVKEQCEKNTGFSVDDFMECAGVYSLHKKIFMQYFNEQVCERQEELLLGEYFYEKREFRNAVLNMLSLIAREKQFYIVLDEINMAGSSVLWMLNEIAGNSRYEHIKAMVILNEEGEKLPFAEKELKKFTSLCEEKDMIYNWFYEEEVLQEEKAVNCSIEKYIKLFNDLLYTFECKQAKYFLDKFLEREEKKSIRINPVQKVQLLEISFWLNIINEEYAYALHVCNTMAKLLPNDDNYIKMRLHIIELKVLAYIYSHDSEQANIELINLERLAVENDDKKMRFKAELYKNMSVYSGWKNLWMCEKDIPVSKELINSCKEYGYLNHLAHIYAFSYNSDVNIFKSTENIESRIGDFNKGIEIGKQLKNGKFLIDAYRKNVMLASTTGRFKVCIYFYEKMLKVAKENTDEIEEAAIYNGLGYSNCGLEHHVEANEYYRNALMLYYKYELPDDIVETLYNMGINAILAGEYNSACDYLLEADLILRTLKKNTLRVCDISKLYGLISLSSLRAGNLHRTRLYLNKAEQFLSDLFSTEDSKFLVHFLSGKLKHRDKKYDEALIDFQKAEHCMFDFYGGSLFFNYCEFIYDYYTLLTDMKMETEANNALEKFYAYCRQNEYQGKMARVKALIENNGNSEIIKSNIALTKVELEDISDLIRRKGEEKEKHALVKTVQFFNILQNFTNHMSHSIKEEIATIIPVFKTTYCIDKLLFIRSKEQENNVLYSDLGYDVSQDDISCIVQYFEEKSGGFCVSKDGMRHIEYQKILSCFNQERILSFVAIPVYDNSNLMCLVIAYNELGNNITSSMDKSFIEESDVEVFTYIFSQLSNAIEKFEMENELVETNRKINEQIEQVLELKDEAEAANVAKSNFLANMSHEIRTPMNAIIGMAEIALRGELKKEQRENVQQIRDSGKALLSIINDILDISKIESGKMEIVVDKYYPHSIIRDVINIIITRIGEKKLEFIVDVVPNIPHVLIGDCVRVRQIIINLVNNAIKFTKEGTVKLLIDYEYISQEEIMIKLSVEDTGIGIKKEDLKKLFTSFQQVDSKRNRNIEGTGLGLSITKQLLALMNGSISVESEYGKGSKFTCVFPQRIATDDESVINDWEKDFTVGIYVDNIYVKTQLEKDLNRLGIEYQIILSEEELQKFAKDRVKFVFADEGVLTDCFIEWVEDNTDIEVILLKEVYSSYDYSLNNLHIFNKPVCSLELEGFFSGNMEFINVSDDKNSYSEFTAPDGQILIVDDNSTNLKVAVGLLEPLMIKIDTATSGKEAVEKISSKIYDIVFMDHMMPELDGVETTHIIRRFHSEYDNVPIIALTANAVSGIKDYFISEGMNDFVAKPIDVGTIVSKIRKWLPKEKIKVQRKINTAKKAETEEKEKTLTIEGLDTEYALKLVGKEKIYWSILEDYYHSIDSRAQVIDAYEKSEDIKAYTIEVHALKSASRQIGAIELADKALALEMAGKSNDIKMIHEKTAELLEKYAEYKEILKPYFDKNEEDDTAAPKQSIEASEIKEIFNQLREALDELDLNKMEEVMAKMAGYSYSEEEVPLYEKLKSAVEQIDSDACEEILNQWENTI